MRSLILGLWLLGIIPYPFPAPTKPSVSDSGLRGWQRMELALKFFFFFDMGFFFPSLKSRRLIFF